MFLLNFKIFKITIYFESLPKMFVDIRCFVFQIVPHSLSQVFLRNGNTDNVLA